MPLKTHACAADLDNASIRFTNVVLPREALLSRFAEIDDDGNYKLLKGGIRPFEMIGQRLFTGARPSPPHRQLCVRARHAGGGAH